MNFKKCISYSSIIFFLIIFTKGVGYGASKEPPITTQGYSIFDETIVDMTWLKVEKAIQEGAIVLFPTGSIEAHGPHMSLGVDAYLAYLKCKLIKRALESRGIKTIIAPPYFWGINNNMGAFPGSFTVRKQTMKALLYDILSSFKRWGFQYLFVINHHGDTEHNFAILEAVKEARIDMGINAYYVLSEFDAKVRYKLTGREHHVLLIPSSVISERPKYLDIHAGSEETGLMVHYFPDQVDIKMAKTLKPTNLTLEGLMEWDQSWDDAKRITPLGYFGDPAGFNPETSRQRMEDFVKDVAGLIENFLKRKWEVKSPEKNNRRRD